MRIHRYPSLFGDPRSRGLWTAITVSMLLHALLFLGFGQFHIRMPARTFFAPLHMVELVEEKPAPGMESPSPPAKGPKPSAIAAKPKSPPTPKPQPKPQQAKPVSKPPPKVAATPQVPAQTIPTESAEPTTETGEYSEERVAERIAQIREKMGEPESRPVETGGDEGEVRGAIESIRQRLGTGGPSSSDKPGAVGIRRGGGNVLQEVRLRAYYTRLWEHVTRHWTIPPPLKGKPYTVIVSVVIDREGQLLKSWVEDSSGSDAFDESALRALERGQPFPPIPDVITDESLEVGFRFHPE